MVSNVLLPAMKTEKIPPGEGPARAGRCWQSKPRRSRLSLIRISVAAFAVLTQGLILGSDGQTLQPPGNGSPSAKAEPASPALLAAEGRRQPSYQVFACGCTSPALTVVNATTLEVGGKQKIDVSRLDQLTTPEKETLAGRLDVPVVVIDCLLRGCTNQTPVDATGLAGKLRVTAIDYKYLLEKWTRYQPPTGGEKVKTDALRALQGGDLEKAWAMYVTLPRPAPPGGFRIAG
jgi:hypothetical protein